MIPFALALQEDYGIPIQSTKAQIQEIWKTICSRSVWQPLGFLYVYNILQVQNTAWKQYLRTVLGFSDVQLNSLLIATYLCLFLGIMSYKYFFLNCSWRRVFLGTIILNAALTSLQLLLIKGKTFGLSNYIFALGDDAAQEFIQSIQFLVRFLILAFFFDLCLNFLTISTRPSSTLKNAKFLSPLLIISALDI